MTEERISFPLLGEPLALELANTIVGDGFDLVPTAAAAQQWLKAHREQLPTRALREPPELGALRTLRDAIRELIIAAMEDRRPDRRALAVVNGASAAGQSVPTLVWSDAPSVRTTPGGEGAAAATLAAIARSAILLVGGPDRARLRTCSAPGCGLRFVATNPRRQWCSANACGNRVRVARHYARHHADSSEAAG